MSNSNKLYQVISVQSVMVEDGGNATSHSHGATFYGSSTNKGIARLLRMNLIREVTARETPNSSN